MPSDSRLAPFVHKLVRRADLDESDQQAVLGLPHQVRQIDRGGSVSRETDPVHRLYILLSGFAFSSKTCASGARGVVALHMEGEPLDISGCANGEAACDVQALTAVEVADISRDDFLELARSRPQIALALWRLTARNASVLSEWLINVGRRNARGRLSHLICEIATRQKALGHAVDDRYVMPLTQEQLGDSTGLTSVHVNRVVQGLRRDRLIGGENRQFTILDWEGLKSAGDFRPGYLMLAA